MAKLMWICGILLFAAGVALGVVVLVSASSPAGMDVQTAAILLVGGILSLGLGGVIDALGGSHEKVAVRSVRPEPAATASTAEIPEFDPRGAMPTPAAEQQASASEEDVSPPTRDTIRALEQARQKIEQAFDARQEAIAEDAGTQDEVAVAEAIEEVVVEEDAVTEEEVMEDGQLYVVEERVIRRHPARILSDGTVEAETSDGWMRFENLEHLDEYLDSMEPARG